MAANTRLTQANILGQDQGLVAFLSHLETELRRSNVGFAAEIFSKLVPLMFLSVTSLCPGSPQFFKQMESARRMVGLPEDHMCWVTWRWPHGLSLTGGHGGSPTSGKLAVPP